MKVKRASVILQRAMRRRKWRKLLMEKIPLFRGPCGFIAAPIVREGSLVGLEGPSARRYERHSCGFLAPTNPFRFWCIAIVENPWFERLSLVAVILNCAVLATQGPPIHESTHGRPLQSEDVGGWELPWTTEEGQRCVELAFTLFFTVELLFKSSAMGFMGHEFSYLADGWNWLDLFVVTISWLPSTFHATPNPPRPILT
uniref:Ion transport domain-containing protein n=1 Tax=Haptolina ericina TaxID=156174 RepID=A0A7S3BQ56_9EUKA